MLAEQTLREGNLQEALAQLQEQVRKDPSNAKYRVFLFQLLIVLGDWDRARTQLSVAGDMDASTLAMVQMYREALNCEALRAEIFAGKRSPLFFGEPEQWLALLIEALRLTAEGQHAQAKQLREQAFEAAPATSGSINARKPGPSPGGDQRFQWIADADSRLGPILEAILNGSYYWIPFHRIQSIDIEEPGDLRDMVWMPAHFTWANGGDTVGLIPTRYTGSEASEDNLIRMARKTDWVEQWEDVYLGLGQRILATDSGEHPLMDVRQITLNTGDRMKEAAQPPTGSDKVTESADG